MNHSTYDLYVETEVDWIGSIPGDWKLKKTGSLFDERKVKVSDKDYPPLSVTKKGIVPQLESAAKTNDNDNRKLVKKGDFVINSRSDRKGSSGLAKEDGSVSLINIVLKPREIHAQFSEYLLKSYGFIEEFYRHGHGIVADLWTTRFAEMKSIYVPYPDLATQTKIARFLDQKTASIDTAIAKKQRLIELLKEQKAILINRAVTRGLNPDVPMKDSGVDWIGEIPAHWDLKRFKFCCSITSGQVDPRTEPYASMALIAPNHIESNTGVLFNIETAKSQGADSGKYLVDKEDIIYSKIRPALRKACISPVNGLCSADMYVLKPSNFMNKGFLLYYLLSDAFTKPALDAAMRVAMPKVNREAMSEFPIVIPNLFEQEQIYSYIDDIHQKSSQVIVAIQKEVKLLQEYKQTLIAHAVTGKIKVS